MAKAAMSAQSASMIPISSIWIPEGIPNRGDGWENKLDDLMDSIRASGQVQPVIVVASPGPNGETYKLLAGQRRLAALKKLNHTTIKAVSMSSKLTKRAEFGTKLAENFGRDNYTPLEEAALIEFAMSTLGMTQKEIAAQIGKTPGWVSQRISASKQPPEIQRALEEGEVSFTHIRELARVKDDDVGKKKLFERAKSENVYDFKDTVDSFLETGDIQSKKQTTAPHKKTSATEQGTELEGIRPKKEAVRMLGKLDKAYVAAKRNEDKERARALSWFIKGVSWAYRYKGAQPPKI